MHWVILTWQLCVLWAFIPAFCIWTDKRLYNLTWIMYVRTRSIFISVCQLIRAVDWVQILFAPFCKNCSFRHVSLPTAMGKVEAGPAPQNGASSLPDFRQPALPSSLCLPCHILRTPWVTELTLTQRKTQGARIGECNNRSMVSNWKRTR